jgi:hypothetical protein
MGIVLFCALWYVGFIAAVIVGYHWRVKRRGTRYPLEFKLRRGPGETLRRKIAKFDEDVFPYSMAAAGIPVGIGSGTTALIASVTTGHEQEALIAGAVAFAVSAVASGAWLFRYIGKRRKWQLGYLGERAVGEFLDTLAANSYQLFHDVPAEGSKQKFNLDHVAVGPAGVAVVETKARRKGRAIAGRAEHIVAFDGEKLIWPWGEETDAIQQTINNADWFRKWIESRTGLEVTVNPVLTIPGWFVQETRSEKIRVVNSKLLPDTISGNYNRVLTTEQIDLICRELDALCRDVED